MKRQSCWDSGPNGYVGFEYELTQYLKPKGSMNTITVCVDRRAYADSRWYVGAGIYRNVSLILRNELYIPSDGIFVTTPQVGNRSMVNVVCEVKNAGTGVKGVNREARSSVRRQDNSFCFR